MVVRQIVILQNAPFGAFQIVILTGLQRPQEGDQSQETQQQGDRNEVEQNVHSIIYRARWIERKAGPPSPKSVPAGFSPHLRRSALAVTAMEDADMATAATSGVT